jgi:hypothetical protein
MAEKRERFYGPWGSRGDETRGVALPMFVRSNITSIQTNFSPPSADKYSPVCIRANQIGGLCCPR